VVDNAPESTGNPLADALASALVGAHETVTEHAHKAGDARLSTWAEAFEAEHRGLASVALQHFMDHPDTPPAVREAFSMITEPVHQTQVLLGVAAVYAIISSFVTAAIGPEMQDVANLAWHLHPSAPLSPADMALGVLKGHLDEGEAAKEAAYSGINAGRFSVLLANTGEPPGAEALMQALRRGFIGEGDFEHGIRQSRIRDEWIPTMLKLRHSPPPAGTAVAAAVQGHLTPEQAAHFIDEAGLDPSNFGWLYETAGRPPGVHELGELVHRGELTVDVLRQAIRESDIKNKYVDAIVALTRKIPPMRTVVAAVHQGVITAEQGARKLAELGYDADDQAMFVREAQNLKHATHRELTEAQIVELYAERMITKAKATEMLSSLNLDATAVEMILALADHKRHLRLQGAATTRLRSLFVSHRIDATELKLQLDKLGIEHDATADMIHVWTLERNVARPHLSTSNWQGAAHRGIVNQHKFQAELRALGWDDHSIPILWAEAWPPTHKAPEWTL
jgi:hypothetical protein